MPRTQAEKEMKTISGVHLVQDIDDTKIDQLKLNTISIAKPTKDDLEDLMLLCRADITSKNQEKVSQYLYNFDLLYFLD